MKKNKIQEYMSLNAIRGSIAKIGQYWVYIDKNNNRTKLDKTMSYSIQRLKEMFE